MPFKMLQKLIKSRMGSRATPSPSPLDEGLGFTIRFAYPDDAAAVRRLAALDCRPVPTGRLLVAEVGGELWAAVSADGEPQVVADPFHHTAALVVLLRDRAERLRRPARPQAAVKAATGLACS